MKSDRPSSPAVTLSPKARYLCALSVTETSVTVNEQAVCRPSESLAVQVAVVVPAGNVDPDGGLHATTTGGSPPVTVAVG